MAKRYDDRYGRGGYRRDRDRSDDRGYMDRAGDEVRSWFGDDDAQRRRSMDEQRDRSQEHQRDRSDWNRSDSNRSDWNRSDWNRSQTNRADWQQRPDWQHSESQRSNWNPSSWDDRARENWNRGREEWRGHSSSVPMRYQDSGRTWSSSDWDRNRHMRNFDERQDRSYRDFDDTRDARHEMRNPGSAAGWSADEGRTEFRDRQQHWGRGPKGYQRSDNRILEDVCDRLTYSEVDAVEIEVRVENGEVTLSGSVRDRADKRRAEEVAEEVSGVRDVHNNIRVQRGDRGLGQSDTSTSDQPGTVLGINPTASSSIANNNAPPKAIKS